MHNKVYPLCLINRFLLITDVIQFIILFPTCNKYYFGFIYLIDWAHELQFRETFSFV